MSSSAPKGNPSFIPTSMLYVHKLGPEVPEWFSVADPIPRCIVALEDRCRWHQEMHHFSASTVASTSLNTLFVTKFVEP